MIQYLQSVTFADRAYLWLLVLLPLLLAYEYFFKVKRLPTFRISNLKAVQAIPPSFKIRLKQLLPVLRVLCLAALIVALARPQSSYSNESITSEGIDIILAMDVSSSMLAEDFSPNRVEAAKAVARDFINARNNDRIGLVVFAGESFTQCPATSDHLVLLNQVKEISSGTGQLQDGTAIGNGLATSVDRLRQSEAKSKVIILMTDGVNNSGFIDPLTATDIAKKYGIRVYTIGVGKEGEAMYPMQNGMRVPMKVDIDEPLLKNIAVNTGGKYFRATDNAKLKNIYKEIDRLEKTKVEVSAFHHKSEEFYPWAMAAGLILLLEVGLRYLIVRAVP
jgi:Ca-activated chloride channel family protein